MFEIILLFPILQDIIEPLFKIFLCLKTANFNFCCPNEYMSMKNIQENTIIPISRVRMYNHYERIISIYKILKCKIKNILKW